MATEREEAIARIVARTGKTSDQAEAFLNILGSAFKRRGWAEGATMTQEMITESLDAFLGAHEADAP